MLVSEALVSMMNLSGISQVQLSERIGRSKNFIAATVCKSRQRNCSISTETMLMAASACGYSIAFVKKGEAPEGAMVLTVKDD